MAGSMEDEATPGRLVDAAIERFGRIDLLVNTIGGAGSKGRSRRWTRRGCSTPSRSTRGPPWR